MKRLKTTSRDTVLPSELTVELDPAPRATIGCLQLPTDLTLDEEGPALIARLRGVRLRLQKVDLDGDGVDIETYETGKDRIERAARTLRPSGSIQALGLACTSLAFTLGQEKVQEEMRRAHPNAAITDMATAVIAALSKLNCTRIALLTPYLDELHQLNLKMLAREGIEVASHRNLGLATDSEISAVSPASILECANAVDDPGAEAFVIGCSAFRACSAGFIDRLEQILGKPVITSQQAFLWHLLRLAGVDDAVGGYGSLLARQMPTPSVSQGRQLDSAAVDRNEDVYPSRVKTPKAIERLDPVVDREQRFAGPLSKSQVDLFDARGHIVLPSVFAPKEVETLKTQFDDLSTHYESLDYEELDRTTDMRVITERGGTLLGGEHGDPILKSIWQVHLPAEDAPHMREAADLSFRCVRDSRLVDAARQLLGDEVYIHQSRINFQRGWGRGSRGGSGFLWHQDFEQWHSEDGMPRMRAVSMAVLLEPAMAANGALMVMPGSHRAMIQAQAPEASDRYATGSLSTGPSLPDEILVETANRHGIVYCQGQPGDVVLFDCNIVHGSHTNISPWGRMMLFAVYNAVSNTAADRPFGASKFRPEHIGSHDPRWAGVALPSLHQSLVEPLAPLAT